MKVYKKYPDAILDSEAETKLWRDEESNTLIETDLNDNIIKETSQEDEDDLKEQLLNDFNNLLNEEEDEY